MREPMTLTATKGVAVIGALFAQAEATRKAIASDWYFHESSRDAALGAVRIVEDTQIALERDTLDDTLNGFRDEALWIEGAQRAEESLRAIKGYSAQATINAVLADTAQATAEDVKSGAEKVASVTGAIAKEALSLTWTALPTVAKVAVVALAVGAVVYFVARASDVVQVARGTA
jgi:hypothetical protein